MSKQLKQFGATLLGTALLCSLSLCSVSSGAELRTTSGDRTIYRTAALERADVAADEVSAAHIDHFDGEWIDGPCQSCGVVGCDMACISLTNWYAGAEYLLWWRQGTDLPPLVTTGPPNAAPVAGVLPDATILFGGDTYGDEARPGGRFTLGKWLDDCETCGVEGRFWTLGASRVNFAADNTDFQILARPFQDPGPPPVNLATLLVFPNFTGPGNVDITSESQVLGGDALYRWCAMDAANTRCDFLAGYQFSRIDEDLNVNSFSTVIADPVIAPGTTFTIVESFRTRNEFHGGQIGLSTIYASCNWRLDLLAKIGLGNMRQVVDIAGQNTIVTPGPNPTVDIQPGPLTGGNVGNFARNTFAVVPELGAKFRFCVHECLDLTAGYSFIYWSNVVQPGDQIDPLLRDPPPAFTFNSSSYWVHGFNIGAECRF